MKKEEREKLAKKLAECKDWKIIAIEQRKREEEKPKD